MPLRPRNAVLAGVAACLFAACLAACGQWNADTAELTARTSTPVQGANCSSCHGYPLEDTNHVFHLYHTSPNKGFNGPITCLDCHFRSLQYHSVVLQDTFYVDTSDFSTWSTVDHPFGIGEDTAAIRIRSLKLDTVIVFHQNRPIPLPKRPGAATSFTEFLTGLAHMNNSVDVEFDPKISDTVRFLGEKASYNPTMETCSAVACHPDGPNKDYRFAAPLKGLPELKN